MCVRCLGFVLIFFPGVLHAQRAARACHAPRLAHGFFVPQANFNQKTTIAYACDNGYKPVVEGWWATSTCEDGKWSHEPQCIDQTACIPPTIPNANYPGNSNGWYEEGSTISITCNEGFEHKTQDTTATCVNGNWSSIPVCEKATNACDAPPKIPRAVIIRERYKEVFAAGSEVQYECEDGYTTERRDTKISICRDGNWTAGPTCREKIRPGAGKGENTAGGREGAHPTPAGRGVQSGGGGSSDDRGTGPFLRIDRCGEIPVIENAVVLQTELSYLKYACQVYYTLEGLDTVTCLSNGKWSQLPTCRATFCSLNTNNNPKYIPAGIIYIKNGEEERVECVKPHSWSLEHYAKVRCINRRLEATKCCNRVEHATSCE